MSIKINVTGVEKTRFRLLQMEKRSLDFRPAFHWVRRELSEAWRTNFNTQGVSSGHPWMPLDSEYERWKLLHRPVASELIETGALYRSLTGLHGRPNLIGLTNATFGTSLPYAKFHQYGTRHMPKRKIVFVPKTLAVSLASKAANHIVYGNIHGISTRRALGLFKT